MAYKIRNYCLGCHYCALECPVGAIRYKGTQYQIDPEKCVECGVCAKVCNVDAIDTGAEPAVKMHEPIEKTADIVVIGAGAGGTIAAVRAAQLTGGKVIVLEKAKKPGGSGWFAGYMLSAEEVPGPGAPPAEDGDMPAPMKKRDMSFLNQFDQELVKNAKASQLEVSRWLMGFDEISSQLRPVDMFGKKAISLPNDGTRLIHNLKCTDNAIGPGRSGSYIIHTMLQSFEKYGVELLTCHRAVSIQTDASGAVTGVVARDPGGETRISCKAVICLSGGFAHNDEMLRKYAPWFFPENDAPAEPVHRFAAPTCTGDVVALGESAGAYIDPDTMYVNLFGPVHHPFTFSLFKACLEGENVCVNLDGRRFFNEEDFSSGAKPICFQRNRVAYSIFSEKNLETAISRVQRGPEGKCLRNWREELQSELDDDNVSLKMADTLEELADKAGIEKEAFLDTVRRYNQFCASGVDEDFGKSARCLAPIQDGPYYAIFGKMATDGAFGGMLVNSRCQVYNKDKTGVVPGLYSAGDCAAGLALAPGGPGDNRRKAVGDMGWAVGGGFMAANSCAEYINSRK